MEDNKTPPSKTNLDQTNPASTEKKPLAKSKHHHEKDKTPVISKDIAPSKENINPPTDSTDSTGQPEQSEKKPLPQKQTVIDDSKDTVSADTKNKKSKRKKWNDLTVKQRVKVLLVSLLGLFCLSGATAFAVLYAQTPPLDVNNFNYIENARIMDVNGNFYQDLQGAELRQNVAINNIPAHVQNAFIAIEDQRFRIHHGVDTKRLGRAVLGVFFGGNLDGPGGSTITQQLIKLTHLNSDKTITRKFKEIILSFKLEKVY
ncbi:MAG: biosynthetic peptidoglycan transglycosylase [Eubacterium sp.]